MGLRSWRVGALIAGGLALAVGATAAAWPDRPAETPLVVGGRSAVAPSVLDEPATTLATSDERVVAAKAVKAKTNAPSRVATNSSSTITPPPTDRLYERRTVSVFPGADIDLVVMAGLGRGKTINLNPRFSGPGPWDTFVWGPGDPALTALTGVPTSERAVGRRIESLPLGKARIVVAWLAAGVLQVDVVDTPYTPGPPASGQTWVETPHLGILVIAEPGQLTYSGAHYPLDFTWEQAGMPTPGPVLDMLYLDHAANLRHPIRITRNQFGEAYAVERPVERFTPALPAVGATARYDDHNGVGSVTVRRDSAAAVSVISTAGRGQYGVIPDPFSKSFADCPVVFARMDTWQARCFGIVSDGARIVAIGFYEPGSHAPAV